MRKRLGKQHKGLLKHMGSCEADSPWFLRERAKIPSSPADAEALLRGAFWHVAKCLRLDRWSWSHKRVTFDWCVRKASELLHNTVDNVRGSLCLLPGWHTSDRNPNAPRVEELDPEDHDGHERSARRDPEDAHYPREASKWARERESEGFFFMIAKILSRETARWWQHPRWHFWHWEFQVPVWQRFRRRFLDRCSKCGVRYKGSSDVHTSWDGDVTWCGKCAGVSVVGPSVSKSP